MPYFALAPAIAGKTQIGTYVLLAKLGIIHSLYKSVCHLTLTPKSVCILTNNEVTWASFKQFTCMQNALAGHFLDPKDYHYVMDPITPNIRTGFELAEFLQEYYPKP